MKYLHKYELFLENNGSNRKYEIVTFNQDYVAENIYGGEDSLVTINIKKGEKAKLFFSKEDNEDQYIINAIRPIEVSQNESKTIETETVTLSELWEANFMFTTPIVIDKDKAPFDIEDYL